MRRLIEVHTASHPTDAAMANARIGCEGARWISCSHMSDSGCVGREIPRDCKLSIADPSSSRDGPNLAEGLPRGKRDQCQVERHLETV